MNTIQVSYLSPTLGSDKARIGTKLSSLQLDEQFFIQSKDIPAIVDGEPKPKHADGAIFPYVQDKLGLTDDSKSGGVLFVDIDCISKTEAIEIFDKFRTLQLYAPFLIAIQYSASHFTSPNPNKSGLHFFIRSYKNLNRHQYTYWQQVASAYIELTLLKVMGKEIHCDDALKSMGQRLFIYPSPYQYALDPLPINDKVSDQDARTALAKTNRSISDGDYNGNRITETTTDIKNEWNTFIDGNGRLLINRNVIVNSKKGILNGNKLRFEISKIAINLFGDKAKEWCDKHFYCDNNRSIFHTNIKGIPAKNADVLEWLENNGFLQRPIPPGTTEINSYLLDKKDDILNILKTTDKLAIIAPTGTGKTTLINEGLAKDLNAVVIVPFNVTNNLYNNLTEISSNTGLNPINDGPMVMVWDQAVKHWGAIKDRNIIVDECHTLFADRLYRESGRRLMTNLLQKQNGKIILISATPLGEIDLLGCKRIAYYKKRDIVNVDLIEVNDTGKGELIALTNAIKNDWYDRIVVFDDRNAQRLLENILTTGNEDDIAYIRSSTKESKDFMELRKTEQLTKKITICTCVAFNGLNFSNENENILVISSVNENDALAADIIQQIGRIRKSRVKGMIMMKKGGKTETEADIEAHYQEVVKIMNCTLENGGDPYDIGVDLGILDAGKKEAMIQIANYKAEKGGIKNTLIGLKETGYINVRRKAWDTEGRIDRKLLRTKSDEYKEAIIEGKWDMAWIDDDKMEWTRRIKKLIASRGGRINLLTRMVELKDKNTLISTILDWCERVQRICSKNEDEWTAYEKSVKKVIGDVKDPITKKKIVSRYSENKKIREKLGDLVGDKNTDYSPLDFDNLPSVDELMDMVMRKENEEYEKKLLDALKKKSNGGKKGASNGGKKGGKIVGKTRVKKVKVIDLPSKYGIEKGSTFNSCKELSEKTGVSINMVTKWIKNGKVIVIE